MSSEIASEKAMTLSFSDVQECHIVKQGNSFCVTIKYTYIRHNLLVNYVPPIDLVEYAIESGQIPAKEDE